MGYKFIQNLKAPYKVENGIIIGDLRMGNPQLTPHFYANEFACPCCKIYKIAIRVLEGLENVRVKAGEPLYVAKTTLNSPTNPGGSGYRCKKHNAATRGASPKSKHMLGYAVDVHPTGSLTVAALYRLMNEEPVFHNGGLGRYSTFVHGDCWLKRRWNG